MASASSRLIINTRYSLSSRTNFATTRPVRPAHRFGKQAIGFFPAFQRNKEIRMVVIDGVDFLMSMNSVISMVRLLSGETDSSSSSGHQNMLARFYFIAPDDLIGRDYFFLFGAKHLALKGRVIFFMKQVK